MKNIYNLLFEETEVVDTPEESMSMPDSSMKARKSLDSIDDQVDALILKYEASSIRDKDLKTRSDGLMESLKNKNLNYLFEEEEDPLAEEDPEFGSDTEEPDAADDSEKEAAPEPVGSEKMDVEEPGEEVVPDLDIDAFAARTVRLIVNHRNLLRVETAIVNRIKNFLDQNYGENFVQQYIDILENQFGMSLEEFEDERNIKDDNFAVGAFAGGTGGLGGGA